MAGIPQSDYYRHGGHVDFPGEQSVLYGYRVANASDGGIVAEKFYGYSAQRSPEAMLLMAVLEQAVADLEAPKLLGNSAQRLLARRSAVDWVLSNRQDVFSFVWVCEGLGLDVEYVRTGICNRFALKA